MRQVLVLSERAYEQMTEDCLRYPDTETGGILVGRYVAGEMIVPFAVPAGTGAERSAGGFAPDSSFQQPLLDFLFERFQGVNYQGDYHKHPGAFDRPSLHDLVTARRIVTDPNWNTAAACFPILTCHKGQVKMRSYLMTREAPQFDELDTEIVADADSRIQAVMLGAVPILNTRKETRGGDIPPGGFRTVRVPRPLNWL